MSRCEERSLVSLIIPCYNHEKFLEDCIKSILKQTYRNLEIIICDDCSTDNSAKVIEKHLSLLKSEFKKVVFIKNDVNQGLTNNLNKMLEITQGEFVKCLASDDFLCEDYFEKSVEFFERNQDIDVAISNGYRVAEESSYEERKNCDLFYKEVPDFDVNTLFVRVYNDNIVFAPGAILRKRVFDKYGVYDSKIAIEDWEYWLRILKDKNCRFGYIDLPLVLYRQNSNSFTSLSGSELGNRRKKIYNAEMAIIDKYGKYVDVSLYAERKYYRMLGELDIAARYDMAEWHSELYKQLKSYDMWKKMRLRNKLSYIKNWKM